MQNIPSVLDPLVYRVAVPHADGGERTYAFAAMSTDPIDEVIEALDGRLLGVDEDFELEQVDAILPKDANELILRHGAGGSRPGF